MDLKGKTVLITGAARGLGAAMATAFTAIGAVLSESVPTRVRGLAMGGYNTCIYGGFAVSAATLGAVISRFGFAAGFAVSAGLCALSVLAFAVVFPHPPARENGSVDP